MTHPTNEAAERLRTGITANEYLYHQDEKAFLADVDDALDTERRNTVERIKLLVHDRWHRVTRDELFAILEEVSGRG